MTRALVLAGLLVVSLTAIAISACGSAPAPVTPSPAKSASAVAAPQLDSSPGAGVGCTTTRPNGSTPPGERPSRLHHGNGRIWTVLPPHGVIVFRPGGPGEIRSDGSLAMKAPFWRGPGVNGDLTITGRSLDDPSLRMRGEVPSGYGDIGFQASTLVFPEPGCWEVTARAGEASLTFVTEVVRER